MMKYFKFIFFVFVFFSTSCIKQDLDSVTNLSDPSTTQVLSSSEDLVSLLGGSFNTVYRGTVARWVTTLDVMADVSTCSWGNYGMRTMSWEPRNPWPNLSAWSDLGVISNPFSSFNSAISSANDVLRAIDQEGLTYTVGGEDKTYILRAGSYFVRGLSYGYLALMYDKAAIVSVDADLEAKIEFSGYKELLNQAIADFEEAKRIITANAGTGVLFEGSTYFNGVDLDSTTFIQLCNSYAARFIVQSARTQMETDAVDWNDVKDKCLAGITADFGPIGDSGTSWWSWQLILGDNPQGFGAFGARIDMRVLNMVDPTLPIFYPIDGTSLDRPLVTSDARFDNGSGNTDAYYKYVSEIKFREERGKFHYSHYIFVRHTNDSTFSNFSDTRKMVHFSLFDNQLLLAEAYLRLGDTASAISTINAGSRVLKGKLTPLASTATEDEIKNAIFYERYIELYNTGPGNGFFDRRRTNDLQVGTPRHMPVPVSQTDIREENAYTFGKVGVDDTGLNSHSDFGTWSLIRVVGDPLPTFN